MTTTKYEYDVAFSFLAEDEQIALDLSARLNTYRTFVYSQRQKEVAGTDGERAFNAVFGTKARFVVVLFRKQWGQTPWTLCARRLAQTRAFRNKRDQFLGSPNT